jgi:hypothetical protein
VVYLAWSTRLVDGSRQRAMRWWADALGRVPGHCGLELLIIEDARGMLRIRRLDLPQRVCRRPAAEGDGSATWSL